MKKDLISFVLCYLKVLAKLQLLKFRPLIIGVGGASGKTSLAKFITLVLQEKYKVRETEGKNSETGIPLSILGISIKNYSLLDWLYAIILAPIKVIFDWEKYEVFVAEMGIDSPLEPKNMSYLLKIIKPKVGVLTNITFEHSEYFDSLVKDKDEKIRAGKILNLTGEQENLLLESIPKDGMAVLNIDDEKIRSSKVKSKRKTVSLKDSKADFFGEKISVDLRKFILKFVNAGKGYTLKIKNPLPNYFAYSFLMAIAICEKLGIDIESSIKTLERKFALPPGRLSVFKGKNNTTIIDSSYNSSLYPLLDSLELLKNVSNGRRKVAILGDMRELGTISKNHHQEAAKKALKTSDLAILIGPLMEKYALPFLSKKTYEVFAFPNFTQAKYKIRKIIKSGDLVLVKGSQNTLYLERVVEMLLENYRDRQKLPRRGGFWDKKRAQTL